MQGNWELVDSQIQEAVRAGRETLEDYTRKMDVKTGIPYAAAVLDPRVKTHLLKAHLNEGAVDVIDDLRAHFNEISPAAAP